MAVVTITRMATQRGARRGRGRPRSDAGGPVLSRDLIARKALDLAGAEGFGAVTMQRLGRELGVTARALYNHVADRQDVIDLVASLMLRRTPQPRFEAEDWREALADAYHRAREAYRSYPRATLISLDETVTDTEIDPARITMTEQMLEFLVGLGLSLEQAVVMRTGFLLDVFGFVLLVDYSYDRSDRDTRELLAQPVPQPWLDAHPDVAAPLSRRAAQLPPSTSDDGFRAVIESRIALIEHLLEG